jgi:hypothetical protein
MFGVPLWGLGRYEWGDDAGAFFESKTAVKPYRPELLQGSDSSDTSSDSDDSVDDADLNVGADEMRRRKALRWVTTLAIAHVVERLRLRLSVPPTLL